MKEVIEKVCQLEYEGLAPSLLIIGKNQQKEIYLIPLGIKTNDSIRNDLKSFDTININGNRMKVIISEEEDVCEVYAKERSKI